MYEQFFHFKQRPFSATPYIRYYVPTEMAETAREQLLRTIRRGEGPGLLIGPPGTGKTMLLQVLKEQCRSNFDVVLLTHGRFPTARALLQTLLHELKQPFHGLEEAELRIALLDYLNDDKNPPLVVLADEADTLKFRILEELRVLTNVQRTSEPALRLVLAGSPSLEERLTAPKLQTLNQRIVVRCYLDALNRADTFNYIRSQIVRAGGKTDQLFPESALQAVYHATGGVPRLINQICDHALVLAYADGIEQITAELVQEAWSDLQQIPIPWGPAPSSTTERNAVIEIGSLTDEAPEQTSYATPMTLEGDSSPQGVVRFGFSEKPGAEPFSSPHVADPAWSSDTDHTLGEARDVFEAVTPDYPTAEAGSPTAGEAENVAVEERSDPLKQIDQIEQAIESLQNESTQCVPSKPQAELVFYDWGDPFEETFLQEIPVRSIKKTGQPLEFEDDSPEEITDTEGQPPITDDVNNQRICSPSPPQVKAQNTEATYQVNEDSVIDGRIPDGQSTASCPAAEANKADCSPIDPRQGDVEARLVTEEPEDSWDSVSRALDAERREADFQRESCTEEICQERLEPMIRFSSHAGNGSTDSEKSNRHRAIMKSLFTRLRKSG